MEIGFFFWPFNVNLVKSLAIQGEQHAYDMIGVADTPGNAMDPWVSATLLATHTTRPRIGLCVTNLISRTPSVTAAAAASLESVASKRTFVGIGAGHSGTHNIALHQKTTAQDLGAGVTFIRRLLNGEAAEVDGEAVRMPWIKQGPKVFVAASHPKSLTQAGARADGVFINYGLREENVRESEGLVLQSMSAAGRSSDDVELWQIAALDCNENGDLAREKIGAMLAFNAGYVIGAKNVDKRGVPQDLIEPLLELRRRYSLRPGDADIRLVRELGLYDYLASRLSVCGTPDERLAQVLAAQAAGVKRLMFSVSLAVDPVKTVDLFARRVLPAIRTTDAASSS